MFKKLLFLTAVFAFAGFVLVSCSSDDKGTDPAPDKVFKVLSPNGGEIYQKGETVKLTFKNELEGDVALSLYKAGEFVYTINAAETSKDSSLWVVPTTLATGTDYKIMIESLSDSTKFDYSDANFAVAPAGEYIIVNSSNGGDIWLKGGVEAKHITWLDNIAGNVDIFLYKNGSEVQKLNSISPEASDGDYGWIIPDDGTFADGADYQIMVVSTDNAAIKDFSDHYFCLASNDNTQNIVGSWDATGTWAKWSTVWDFASDGKWTNGFIEAGTWSMTGNGLKVTFEGNSRCFLAIVDDDDMAGSMAEGDDFGTWSAVRMSPVVTAPNGGEVWMRGTTKTITWTPVSKSDVIISLTDSTGVVQNIATVADSLGTYEWAIPGTITPNADYKIKITQVINNASNDESDNYFCISSDETVDVLGNWESGFIITKGNMTLVLNGDGTGTFTTWSTWNGNWTLTGNGLKFVTDYAFTNYWIAIVEGDKLKGTFIDDVNKGTWDGKRPLDISTPNGGNVYQPADVVPITWTENLSAESAIIDLYENDVLSRNIGTVNINNFTSFNWTVPSNLLTSTKYKIRITSAVNSDIYDESDAYFTVNGVSPTPAIEDETFDDGLAQNWTGVIGNWSVADSAYTVNSDSLTVTSAEYTTALTGNYMVEAKMKKITGQEWFYGLFINGDDSDIDGSGYWKNTALFVVLPEGNYGFFVAVNGVWTGGYYTTTAVNAGMDVWNTLKVIVNNDNGDYHLFINGQYIQTFNNPAHNSGKVGFTYYDDTLTGSGAVDYVKISRVNKGEIKNINVKRINVMPKSLPSAK